MLTADLLRSLAVCFQGFQIGSLTACGADEAHNVFNFRCDPSGINKIFQAVAGPIFVRQCCVYYLMRCHGIVCGYGWRCALATAKTCRNIHKKSTKKRNYFSLPTQPTENQYHERRGKIHRKSPPGKRLQGKARFPTFSDIPA